jgi:hypothetical protein
MQLGCYSDPLHQKRKKNWLHWDSNPGQLGQKWPCTQGTWVNQLLLMKITRGDLYCAKSLLACISWTRAYGEESHDTFSTFPVKFQKIPSAVRSWTSFSQWLLVSESSKGTLQKPENQIITFKVKLGKKIN